MEQLLLLVKLIENFCGKAICLPIFNADNEVNKIYKKIELHKEIKKNSNLLVFPIKKMNYLSSK